MLELPHCHPGCATLGKLLNLLCLRFIIHKVARIALTYLWGSPYLTGLLRGLSELRRALSTGPYTEKVLVNIGYTVMGFLLRSDQMLRKNSHLR